jgi:hypothetical protein
MRPHDVDEADDGTVLAAYETSVAEAGKAGWCEERGRIAQLR